MMMRPPPPPYLLLLLLLLVVVVVMTPPPSRRSRPRSRSSRSRSTRRASGPSSSASGRRTATSPASQTEAATGRSRPSSAPSAPSPARRIPSSPARLYLVNLGANDGRTIDPLYPFFIAGAHGLVVEYGADFPPLLHANLPWPRVAKRQAAVAPRTLTATLLAAGVPRRPDVLKLDIDGFDLHVLDALLRNRTFAPRVLLVEIDEKVPPSLRLQSTSTSSPRRPAGAATTASAPSSRPSSTPCGPSATSQSHSVGTTSTSSRPPSSTPSSAPADFV